MTSGTTPPSRLVSAAAVAARWFATTHRHCHFTVLVVIFLLLSGAVPVVGSTSHDDYDNNGGGPLVATIHTKKTRNENQRMGGTVSDFLTQLEEHQLLTSDQASFLQTQFPDKDDIPQDYHLQTSSASADEEVVRLQDAELRAYLQDQVVQGALALSTRNYVQNLLQLRNDEDEEPPRPVSLPAKASYDTSGNGRVEFLGVLNPSPPDTSVPPVGERYNGIWGYATGQREYALQCHSNGLHIIDVTTPSAPVRVQYIPMAGGLVWRDVETYTHPVKGTFAYVGAQDVGGVVENSAQLYVVNLSCLASGSTPMAADSGNCRYINRGYPGRGHTLHVDTASGLLLLNSAGEFSWGCQIFDLTFDPWLPRLVENSYEGAMRDCHDSLAVRQVVPGSGVRGAPRSLLYVADGFTSQYRVVDVTDVRKGGEPRVLAETPVIPTDQFVYAHSGALTEDGRYLFGFDETNTYDVLVYDVQDFSNVQWVHAFAYHNDASADAVVHNGQIRGNYLWIAYYAAGLRVFDISNPTNPVEVGSFPTHPGGPGFAPSYDGAWNCFLGLPSGNALVADQLQGTYIFRLQGE